MSILSRTILRRSALAARTSSRLAFAPRTLHQTAAARYAYKDDQDRTSLKPKAHEYTASGTDEETAAAHGDAAFNPDKTSPEAAKEAADQSGKQNPLQNSPANKEFAEAGKGKEEDRPHGGQKKSSGGGSTPKAGKV